MKIFAKTFEDEALAQVKAINSSPFGGEEAHIRIMPDGHSGKGCVVGTTMFLAGKACPNVIGVDIGCGVTAYRLNDYVSVDRLDEICRTKVYSGTAIRSKHYDYFGMELIKNLRCVDRLKNIDRLDKSMGTLGGGNHYIELDLDNEGSGNPWLVVHSGSRNLGLQVANYYQSIAEQKAKDKYNSIIKSIIEGYKANGWERLIEDTIHMYDNMNPKNLNMDLAYLEGSDLEDYIHDMGICQEWARYNREAILSDIMKEARVFFDYSIESIHNYIDMKYGIIRKGAISAQKGELCLIPLNMRDGLLFCEGKGNPDWNYSAPHGAGRLMSRTEARKQISLEQFQESMDGIASSTVCEATIDEAPFAYKDMNEIIKSIQPTVKILDRGIPIYNYKATT